MQGLHKKNTRRKLIAILLASTLFLTGCANTLTKDLSETDFAGILDYPDIIKEDEQDLINSVFLLDSDIRNQIRSQFASTSKHNFARRLSRWLMDPKGRAMRYDLEANLTPAQALKEGRANCLSFSLLLIALGAELGIELKLNQVDAPDFWGREELNGFVFFRHVNVIYKSHSQTQVFDLAMEEYRAGFPQRVINQRHGAALLFSNIGVQELTAGNIDSALHYLKLSVAIFPKNADGWINLAAAYRRSGDAAMIEKIYLKAISLGDENSLASSNLERLYKRQGNIAKSRYFERRARKTRLRSPYIQYHLAQEAFGDGEYGKANSSIRRAIRLHGADPKFYELSSKIRQAKNKYVAAVKDLEKAYKLSNKPLERDRYVRKIKLIVARSKEYAAEQHNRRVNNQNALYLLRDSGQ